MITTGLLTRAKKVNNYIVDAGDTGTGNDKWDSSTLMIYTVPTGYRWFLLPSFVLLDASGTLVIYTRDASGKFTGILANYTAGTGAKPYPAQALGARAAMPTILDAGEDVHITCGAAQGAGAKASCVVLEVKT